MSQFFYDGQIRRYLTQTIRVLSNFVVKYGDGTLVRVPVMYGDADRQAMSIVRQNSENTVNSCPRISVYITGLDIDRSRLADSTYVGKLNIREREVEPISNTYSTGQGRNYTVERLMPTPFKLTMKVDIWSANTDQKLQILEQILVLFNPSLELQTNDNYIDWTSLSVLELTSINWSSRSVPVGADSPIDIATLTFDTPIWISPPVKVKHLGIITKIITSLYDTSDSYKSMYINGLDPLVTETDVGFSGLLATDIVTITDYNIQVYGNQITLLGSLESSSSQKLSNEMPVRHSIAINWQEVFDQYPGKYVAGSSTIFLTQSSGVDIIGTVAINPLDNTVLLASWDADTLNRNTGIDSQGNLDTDTNYNTSVNHRTQSPGTFDAIIDPLKVGPGHGIEAVVAGDRFLIIEDIGDPINSNGAVAWKNSDQSDAVAKANDIIEWSGTEWVPIFKAIEESDTLIFQTNIYTGIQYMWNGVAWVKSFEGDYRVGSWRLDL
jgi:hypothetical protein